MGMILRIASSRIVGQGDIVGRSGYFSLNLSANSVMRGRLDARRTLKSLVADLRHTKKMDRDISLDAIKLVACIFVCTLHTIGMFMSESSDFHLSYLLFYMSGIAVPLFFMVNGFLLAPKDGGMKYYYRKIFNIVKIVCVFTFIFDIPKLVRGDISILMPFKQACSSLFFQGGVFPVFWFLGSLIFIYALMPFLKKYIISIRTRLYGLLLFLSVLQFIIYTCDIYTNYVYSFIFENVYIPQSFRLYSHLMYFLLGVCLRLYLTDNNMLKNVIRGG